MEMLSSDEESEAYDWFAFTRNDVFWAYPHPQPWLLNHEKWMQPGSGWSENPYDLRPVDIWIPACFDYAGINDRVYTIRLRPGGDFDWRDREFQEEEEEQDQGVEGETKRNKTAEEIQAREDQQIEIAKKKRIREQIRKAKKVFFRFTRAVYGRPGGMPMVRADGLPPPNAQDPSDVSWRFLKGFDGGVGAQEVNGELSFRRFLDHHDFKIGRFDCICALVKTGQLANDLIGNVMEKIVESKRRYEMKRLQHVDDGIKIGGKNTEAEVSSTSSTTTPPPPPSTSPPPPPIVPKEQIDEDETGDPHYCRELQTPGFSEIFGRHRISFRNHQLFDSTVQLNADLQPNGVDRWMSSSKKSKKADWTVALPVVIPDRFVALGKGEAKAGAEEQKGTSTSGTSTTSASPAPSPTVSEVTDSSSSSTDNIKSAEEKFAALLHSVVQDLSHGTDGAKVVANHPELLAKLKKYRYSHDGVMKFSQKDLDFNEASVNHGAVQSVLDAFRRKPRRRWSALENRFIVNRLGSHMFLQRESCKKLVIRGMAHWAAYLSPMRQGGPKGAIPVNLDWFQPQNMDEELDTRIKQPAFGLEQLLFNAEKSGLNVSSVVHRWKRRTEQGDGHDSGSTTATSSISSAQSKNFPQTLVDFVQSKIDEATDYLIGKYCDTAPVWWEPMSESIVLRDSQHVWAQVKGFLSKSLDLKIEDRENILKALTNTTLTTASSPSSVEQASAASESSPSSSISGAEEKTGYAIQSLLGHSSKIPLGNYDRSMHTLVDDFRYELVCPMMEWDKVNLTEWHPVAHHQYNCSALTAPEQQYVNTMVSNMDHATAGVPGLNEMMELHMEDRILAFLLLSHRGVLEVVNARREADRQQKAKVLAGGLSSDVNEKSESPPAVTSAAEEEQLVDEPLPDISTQFGRHLNLKMFAKLYASQQLGPDLGFSTPFDNHFFMYNNTLLCKPYNDDVAYTWNRDTVVVKQSQSGYLAATDLHHQSTILDTEGVVGEGAGGRGSSTPSSSTGPAQVVEDVKMMRAINNDHVVAATMQEQGGPTNKRVFGRYKKAADGSLTELVVHSGPFFRNRSHDYIMDNYSPEKYLDRNSNPGRTAKWGARDHFVETPRNRNIPSDMFTPKGTRPDAPYGEEELSIYPMVLSRRAGRYLNQHDPEELHPEDLYTHEMRDDDMRRGKDLQARLMEILNAVSREAEEATVDLLNIPESITKEGSEPEGPSESSPKRTRRTFPWQREGSSDKPVGEDHPHQKNGQASPAKPAEPTGRVLDALFNRLPDAEEALTHPTELVRDLDDSQWKELSEYEKSLDPIIDYDEFVDRNFRRAHVASSQASEVSRSIPVEQQDKWWAEYFTKNDSVGRKYYQQMREAYDSKESGNLDTAHIPLNMQMAMLTELNKVPAYPKQDPNGPQKYRLFKSRVPRRRTCAGMEYFSELPFGYSTVDYWEPESQQRHARHPGQPSCMSCWLRGPRYSQNTGWLCWKAKEMKKNQPSRCCGRLESPFLHANLWMHYPRTECLMADHLCSDHLFGMWRRNLKQGWPNVKEAQRPDRRDHADAPLSNLIY
ncbi:unnamed protein product [Amoebophrya sp. A25]|nr:unnamed protein product [Amoebophrya sp. A25]|eukprot:GSA25T00012304001.1